MTERASSATPSSAACSSTATKPPEDARSAAPARPTRLNAHRHRRGCRARARLPGRATSSSTPRSTAASIRRHRRDVRDWSLVRALATERKLTLAGGPSTPDERRATRFCESAPVLRRRRKRRRPAVTASARKATRTWRRRPRLRRRRSRRLDQVPSPEVGARDDLRRGGLSPFVEAVEEAIGGRLALRHEAPSMRRSRWQRARPCPSRELLNRAGARGRPSAISMHLFRDVWDERLPSRKRAPARPSPGILPCACAVDLVVAVQVTAVSASAAASALSS